MSSTGTVFDIGYQGYTGTREGRGRGRKAIYKDGLRIALGLGRGPRAKLLPWLFVAVLIFIAFVMAVVANAIDMNAGAGAAEKMNIPSHSDYNGIASIVMFVFAAVVGPELLCRDRRDGVINLYLVRPITGTDYIASRWAAFFTLMTGAAWAPQIVLFFGLSMGAADPGSYVSTHWQNVPKFLLAGLAMSAYVSTIALLAASFTSRRAYASVFLVGLFAITTPFTVGLASEVEGPLGQWISMFNLTNIPVHVNDIIFDDISEVTSEAPAGKLAAWIRIAWYFAWTIIPATVLWMRYRRLKP